MKTLALPQTNLEGSSVILGLMRILEMEDSDWHDVIDNNLNGTANTIRAFAPKMVARKRGRIIVLSSMQVSTAPRMPPATPRPSGEFSVS